jgi:osmotically inducible lipoprotein OsmB
VDIMKTSWMTAAAISSLLTFAGCAATGPNQQLGIAGGAVGGAVLGNAIGGNAASTVGGAAIGGLIGNEVGRNADQRNNYNNRGYYPSNGPRY